MTIYELVESRLIGSTALDSSETGDQYIGSDE